MQRHSSDQEGIKQNEKSIKVTLRRPLTNKQTNTCCVDPTVVYSLSKLIDQGLLKGRAREIIDVYYAL